MRHLRRIRRMVVATTLPTLMASLALAGGLDFCQEEDLSIPDVGVVTSLLNIATGNRCPHIEDLDVSLKVEHTSVGELTFTLKHTGAPPVSAVICDRPGVPATMSGCPGDDIDALINDEAAAAIEFECSPTPPAIDGEFIGGDPPNPALLAAFDGDELCGAWELTIEDATASGNAGTVSRWCVIFNAADEVPATGLPGLLLLTGLMLALAARFR